ncbi:hypothetical protein APHAL10511_007456 [Amanita phalloides]|nr:hypothetical protein APHAL10511_007456 [Amanita phalloides]
MDSIDATQIGRYGTLSLLKQQDLPSVITAFGIDTEQLTFGRDRDCGVRLYYPDVDLIHCKIIFEERKAFLVVLGEHGLLVDGCFVCPATSANGAPTMIPLNNNSEIEIHSKRFRFTYPPKELRATLFASPIRPNRALRLSMIHSAQVFSPRPSQDPQENLRVLQSPLRARFLRSPLKLHRLSQGIALRRSLSPTKQSLNYIPYDIEEEEAEVDEDEDEDENIVLVEGNHPRVVEEEKDLVILEDVEMPSFYSEFASSHSSGFRTQQHASFSSAQTPQTPSGARSSSRNSLHRTVLIRSVQRAVQQAEKEKQDEVEEMEVLSTVASDEDLELNDSDEHEGYQEKAIDGDIVMDSEDRNDEAAEIGLRRGSTQSKAWRPPPGPAGHGEQHIHSDSDHDKTPKQNEHFIIYSTPKANQNEDEKSGDESGADTNLVQPQQFVTNRKLGAFMTPQPRSKRHLQEASSLRRNLFNIQQSPASSQDLKSTEQGPLRYSIGGGEPRRILVEVPWRVKDLVVPLEKQQDRSAASSGNLVGHLQRSSNMPRVAPPTTPRLAKRLIDDQERKAIQERRRSALHEMDTFFIGGIPGSGVSPCKSSPNRQNRDSVVTLGQLRISLEDQQDVGVNPTVTEHLNVKKEDEEDEVDTRSLLEKMKVTVEEMKRRRSTMLNVQPVFEMEESSAIDSDLPVNAANAGDDELQEEDLMDVKQTQPFSLLRSSAKQEARTRQDGGIGSVKLPQIIVEPLEKIDDGSVEKTFSQLMTSDSPEYMERSSDDIRDILEQDISIPSDDHEPASVVVSSNCVTPVQRTRIGSVALAEPQSALPTARHGIGNGPSAYSESSAGENSSEQSEAETEARRPIRRVQKTAVTSKARVPVKVSKPEADQVTEHLGSEDDETEVPPKTVARARRGRSLRGALSSGPSTRARTAVSASRPKGTPNDSEEESHNNAETKVATGGRLLITSSRGRGRPRKVKEEERDVPAVEKTSRTRSATITNDGYAAAKTPVTRAGSRKLPATAPSVVPAALGEREGGDRENPRRAKVVHDEGVRVKITRNRKPTLNATATTSKNPGVARIKAEETEGSATRRTTRTRTRTRTKT